MMTSRRKPKDASLASEWRLTARCWRLCVDCGTECNHESKSSSRIFVWTLGSSCQILRLLAFFGVREFEICEKPATSGTDVLENQCTYIGRFTTSMRSNPALKGDLCRPVALVIITGALLYAVCWTSAKCCDCVFQLAREGRSFTFSCAFSVVFRFPCWQERSVGRFS